MIFTADDIALFLEEAGLEGEDVVAHDEDDIRFYTFVETVCRHDYGTLKVCLQNGQMFDVTIRESQGMSPPSKPVRLYLLAA